MKLHSLFVPVLILGVLASGCSLETKIEDLNQIKKPNASKSEFGIKISGGAQQLSGNDVDADISIGLKNRIIKGSTVDVEATISAARPE